MNVSLSVAIPFLRGRDADQDQVRISAARKGDRGAFDALVSEYQRDLRIFLLRRISDSEIEDVLQDTWLAAWNSLHTFDSKSRFKTWLFAIALNKTRDHYRQQKSKFKAVANEDLVSEDDLGEKTLIKELVRGAIMELTQSQREVLELYYFASFTLPEVARALNRNLNTVKYQFYRAHVEVSDYLNAKDTKSNSATRGKAWR